MEVGHDCSASRDEIIDALHAENILARKYFWPGCHKMKPYSDLFPQAEIMLTNTQRVANRVVVLPTGAAMSESMVEKVISVIRILLENK